MIDLSAPHEPCPFPGTMYYKFNYVQQDIPVIRCSQELISLPRCESVCVLPATSFLFLPWIIKIHFLPLQLVVILNWQFSRKCSSQWKASRTLLGRKQYIFLKNQKIRCEVQNCTGHKLHTMSLERVLVDFVIVCMIYALEKIFCKETKKWILIK